MASAAGVRCALLAAMATLHLALALRDALDAQDVLAASMVAGKGPEDLGVGDRVMAREQIGTGKYGVPKGTRGKVNEVTHGGAFVTVEWYIPEHKVGSTKVPKHTMTSKVGRGKQLLFLFQEGDRVRLKESIGGSTRYEVKKGTKGVIDKVTPGQGETVVVKVKWDPVLAKPYILPPEPSIFAKDAQDTLLQLLLPEAIECRALYDYTAPTSDELSFQAGDIIYITSQQEDGWWFGTTRDDSQEGFVPSNYLIKAGFRVYKSQRDSGYYTVPDDEPESSSEGSTPGDGRPSGEVHYWTNPYSEKDKAWYDSKDYRWCRGEVIEVSGVNVVIRVYVQLDEGKGKSFRTQPLPFNDARIMSRKFPPMGSGVFATTDIAYEGQDVIEAGSRGVVKEVQIAAVVIEFEMKTPGETKMLYVRDVDFDKLRRLYQPRKDELDEDVKALYTSPGRGPGDKPTEPDQDATTEEPVYLRIGKQGFNELQRHMQIPVVVEKSERRPSEEKAHEEALDEGERKIEAAGKERPQAEVDAQRKREAEKLARLKRRQKRRTYPGQQETLQQWAKLLDERQVGQALMTQVPYSGNDLRFQQHLSQPVFMGRALLESRSASGSRSEAADHSEEQMDLA